MVQSRKKTSVGTRRPGMNTPRPRQTDPRRDFTPFPMGPTGVANTLNVRGGTPMPQGAGTPAAIAPPQGPPSASAGTPQAAAQALMANQANAARAQMAMQALGGAQQQVAPGSSGVFSSMPGAQGLLAQALAGPTVTPTFGTITGLAGGDKTFQTGQTVTPQITQYDVLAQMVADQRNQELAAAEQRGREEQGLGLVAQSLTGATGGIRGAAGQLPYRTQAILGQERAGAAGQLGEIRETSRAMPGQAAERTGAAAEDVEGRRQEALETYQDATAADLQSQRIAEEANLKAREDRIRAEAQQRGVDPSDPSVEAAVRQERARSADRMGQIAMDGAKAYNDTMSQIRQSYDTLAIGVSEAGAGREQRAEEMGLQGLVTAYQQEDAMRQLAVQERTAAEQQRAQMLTLAAQMELQGNEWMAGWLREETTYTSPMAPLLAMALTFQQGEAQRGTVASAPSFGPAREALLSGQLQGGGQIEGSYAPLSGINV